jgi:8-oxo-dGTP pyrophosphatase MutT (NUDIX family)
MAFGVLCGPYLDELTGSIALGQRIALLTRRPHPVQFAAEALFSGWVRTGGSRGRAIRGIPGVPGVSGVDPELVRRGDRVAFDGSMGALELLDVTPVHVVTSFLEKDDGRILLLRRSGRVGSFRGFWAGVSGFLEEVTPKAQAFREIEEETGIPSPLLALVSEGAPVYARDRDRVYVVHPFRFRTGESEVRLDWEHSESEWVRPSEIRERSTVPRLKDAWEAVAPGSAPRRAKAKVADVR